MSLLREFWRRHRRKIFIATGVIGSGYLAYKLYDAHKSRLADLERELAGERDNAELSKNKMQQLFKDVQSIADTVKLPAAIRELSSRLDEEVDAFIILEKLDRGKGTLTSSEKLGLWEEMKLLSFTRMAISLWAVPLLSLYIKVQANILGRHLYVKTATGLGSSHLLEDADANLIDKEDEQNFIESADFLATYGFPGLLSDMRRAVTEVLKEKQLKDIFNTTVFRETVMRILDTFLGTGSPHHWLSYLMPEDSRVYKQILGSSNSRTTSPDATKFDQLMMETREVLESTDFASVVEISLKLALGALVEDLEAQTGGGLSSGMPLAKLVPQLMKQTNPALTSEPSENHLIQVIQSVAEVELFFTLLYSSTSAS